MKIKYFFLAAAMFVAGSANAQILKDGHVTANVNLGSISSTGGFGIGVGYQTRELVTGKLGSLAWDVAQFEWNAPFNSPSTWDFLSLKTGARAFSPSFANGKLRAFTNLGLGYTCALVKLPNVGGWDDWYDYDWDDFDYDDFDWSSFDPDDFDEDGGGTSMKAHHGFGLTWGIGVQFNQKISLGYTLQYETAWKTKSHFATISYTF